MTISYLEDIAGLAEDVPEIRADFENAVIYVKESPAERIFAATDSDGDLFYDTITDCLNTKADEGIIEKIKYYFFYAEKKLYELRKASSAFNQVTGPDLKEDLIKLGLHRF